MVQLVGQSATNASSPNSWPHLEVSLNKTQNLRCYNLVKVDFAIELLYCIALVCTRVRNKVALSVCIYLFTNF